jgi:CheY-like chemotaxis protein
VSSLPSHIAIHGGRSATVEADRAAEPVNLRLLVVEDDPDCRELLVELLTDWGHATAVAADGPTAIRLAAESPPEFVLLDIGMPEMNGYEVARRLRAMDATRGAVLVALTGYARDQDRERAWEAGFDIFLVKPASPESIQRVLRAGAEILRSLGPLALQPLVSRS